MTHQFEEHNDPQPLATWLLRLLLEHKTPSDTTNTEREHSLTDYHPLFFQQLPNFIMALLQNDPNATLHYAPLLYHLIGCETCHQAYKELYIALHEALEPNGDYAPLGATTSTFDTTPPTTLILLCQLLISQAESVKRQAQHEHTEHTDHDELARSLLQQALHLSKHLTQDSMRQKALADLVRVATLYEDTTGQGPTIGSLAPVAISSGGTRRGSGVLRRIGTPPHPTEQPVIYLHADTLDGSITQEGDTLLLHLHNLDKRLHGQYLSITVPLGALLEPVRWRGGDPRTIRSTVPVDEHGTVSTPLGDTELRLSNTEDHNLLEAMFLLLEVRQVS